ncbi:facilitated trehalose transporter Tret1-like [Macrosteles quadrilineatus]|uniref:facilitated trehalose transporter Tret1-like n=1 Tax=Macrosteles quadrilineatus TaxID=74068 RepID=UPI0023E325D0|nr:facilitated trehalose transporter Tret1-like [Macrosteles quadrilineatus]
MRSHTVGVLRQYAAAISAAIPVFIVGSWISWPSSAVKSILSGETNLDITPEELSWVVSLLDLGNALSPIPSSFVSNWLGRKPTLVALSVSFLGASLLVVFATNVYYLYIARLIIGIGKGLAFTVVPIYLGETAGTKVRGSVGTLFLGLMNYGILFELCIGPLVSYETLNLLSIPFPIIFFLLFFQVPESPYYMLMKGRVKDAQKSLSWFRSLEEDSAELQQELKQIATNVEQDMKQRGSYLELINTPSARRATLIIMGLSSLQRFTGATCITAYSTTTLPPTGGYFSPSVYMVFFGITMILGQVICSTLVDIFGRKPLLIMSGFGCAVSTAASALFYWLDESCDISAFNWVPYLGVVIYGVSFSTGLGTIPPIICAELYPANHVLLF